MFIKADQSGLVYPYTFRMLREDNKMVSFPSDAMRQPALLAEYNVYPVIETPPTFDPLTQRLERREVLLVGSDYEQQFIVQNLPSKLDLPTNNRQPTSGELIARMTTDPQSVFIYYMAQVQELKIQKVAADNNLMDLIPQRDGTYKLQGDMSKAAKYAQLAGSSRRALSLALMRWEDDVWTFLETRWAEVAGGDNPPTWAELEAEIDAAHPEP